MPVLTRKRVAGGAVEKFVHDALSALVRFREEWRSPNYAPYRMRMAKDNKALLAALVCTRLSLLG